MIDYIVNDDYALEKYNGLGGDIVIPDGVKHYLYNAFYSCNNIESVTLPDLSASVPKDIYCSSYIARETNKYFSSIDGVLYSKDKTVIKAIPKKCTGKLVIPSGVVSADYNAINRLMISELVIPEGFKALSVDYLDNLNCLVLPDSLVNLFICYAPNLKSLVVPENVNSLSLIRVPSLEMLEIKNPKYIWGRGFSDMDGLLCLVHHADKPLSEYPKQKRQISLGIVWKKYNGMPVSDESLISALTYIKRNKTRINWLKVFNLDTAFIRFVFDYKVLKEDQIEQLIDELIETKSNEGESEFVAQLLEIKNELYPSSEQFERILKRTELEMKKAEKEIIYQEKLKDKTSKEYMKTIWSFTSCGDDCVKVHKYLGNETNIVVPNYICGKKVVEITQNAFSPLGKPENRRDFFKYKLEQVYIPETVEKIGSCIFKSCFSLKRVDMASSNIKIIPEDAFMNCTRLKEVEIPQTITKIEKYAFFNCKKLECIDIPDSTLVIEVGAFEYCTIIKQVNFGANLIAIGERAFSKCISIKDLLFPMNIKSIHHSAFSACRSIENIVAPVTIKKDVESVLNHTLNFIHVNYYDPA